MIELPYISSHLYFIMNSQWRKKQRALYTYYVLVEHKVSLVLLELLLPETQPCLGRRFISQPGNDAEWSAREGWLGPL